jgi:hypothetical protein
MKMGVARPTLVCLTNDEELLDKPLVEKSWAEMEAYLSASPRNALVFKANPVVPAYWSAEKRAKAAKVKTKKVYIVRGASEELNNFYFGLWPTEDPNDAEGGNLSAIQAIFEASRLSAPRPLKLK